MNTSIQKHTPGPWNCKASTYKGLSGGIVRDENNDPVADCRYSEVVMRDKKTPETINANALLIAAAPELLEALKEAQTRLEEDYYELFSGGSVSMNAAAILNLVNAAIAKAEGR